MKKKILDILGIVIFALAIIVFVAPVGSGIHASVKAVGSTAGDLDWSGYTVIFGNWANSYIKEASGANIAGFTLLVIGVVFQTIAAILLFPNPNGSKKLSGFLFVLGGLMELAFGIILLCCKSTTGLDAVESLNAAYNLKLGVGVILSSVAALLGAVLSVGAGVLAWGNKNK